MPRPRSGTGEYLAPEPITAHTCDPDESTERPPTSGRKP